MIVSEIFQCKIKRSLEQFCLKRAFRINEMSIYQRWSPRGRPWPRGHILKSLALASKVKSLALALKPQVLENCPVLSLRIALFFEQFVGKRQKLCRKFANSFFVFLTWSIGVAKGRGTGGPPPPQLKFHQWQKCDKKAYSFFSFSFTFTFFAYNSTTNNNIEDQGLRVPLKSTFASQFNHITRRKRGVFVLKVDISSPHLAFLWT